MSHTSISYNSDCLLDHLNSLYNNESLSDFVIEDESNQKLFLNKCVISTIQFFNSLFGKDFGDDKTKIKVSSIKSVAPIFKSVYAFSESGIMDELKTYSVDELADFLSDVDFYGATCVYPLAIDIIEISFKRIFDENISHCNVITTLFESILGNHDEKRNIIYDIPARVKIIERRMIQYLSLIIFELQVEFINTDMFHKLSKSVQRDFIISRKRYDLVDSYIDHMGHMAFENCRSEFRELCSEEQFSRLHGDWSYLKIISVYPEFVLHVAEKVGRVESQSKEYESTVIKLTSSSLSLDQEILIGRDVHVKIKKILLDVTNVGKMYPGPYYSITVDRSNCENKECYYPGQGVYEIKTISHRYSST